MPLLRWQNMRDDASLCALRAQMRTQRVQYAPRKEAERAASKSVRKIRGACR